MNIEILMLKVQIAEVGKVHEAVKQLRRTLATKIGWLTVKELIETETARMVYRSINKEAPNYLTTLFDRLLDISVKELCNTNTDLKLPRLKTSNGQWCFVYRWAQLWGNHSAEVKTAPTLNQFKAAYKNSKKSSRFIR